MKNPPLKVTTAFALVIAMGTFAACATPRTTIDTDALAAQAQAALPERAVISIQNPRHVMASMKAVEGLRALDPPIESIRVLVAGEAIFKLQKDSEWREDIEAAIANGVQFSACELAMERLGIDEDTLIPGVDLTHHVFVESIRLQQLGWYSIEY